jgi:hypothetical protein
MWIRTRLREDPETDAGPKGTRKTDGEQTHRRRKEVAKPKVLLYVLLHYSTVPLFLSLGLYILRLFSSVPFRLRLTSPG